MKGVLTIPHRPSPGMCPVNGIRDLIEWRSGRNWSNEFIFGLGLGGGFAYLRFKSANPPRQVFWGNGGPRQHKYLADLLTAKYTEIEKRSFKFSWNKARQAVDARTPPVLGPLDMFYLPFYEGIYQERHIPIHYVLLVGYDEETAHILDTAHPDVQDLKLDELQLAWNVNVPGLGKQNRLVVFDIPKTLPPAEAIIQRSLADECHTMLHPPVSIVGLPAMKKIAREIAAWPDELGEQVTSSCIQQIREYLNSPPDLEGDHLTAGRDIYIEFLQEAGSMANMDLTVPIKHI